jgi:predicted alpha/beta-hydrolase family hydrolase
VSGEPARFAWRDGDVSGAVHRPASDRRATLIWAHGAGGSMDHPHVVGVAEGLAARRVEVVRFNFPYKEQGRKAPDRGDKLEACYLGVADAVASTADRLYLGGGSMGGRIASQIVAGGFPAAGLAFQSYPLHPPGKPERLRDEHLYRIGVPMLFVSGTKDEFASGDLLDGVVAKLPTATLHRSEGANHGLRVKGRTPAEVLAEVVDTIDAWIA